MEQLKDEYVSVEHLLIALSEVSGTASSRILSGRGVTRDKIYQVLTDIRGTQRVTDQAPEEKYQALKRFTRDLTELAQKGKLDPVIGRDEDHELSKSSREGPRITVLRTRVGKTAIVEGLAGRIVSGDIPKHLKESER
jgi:ATP-dependent Clp protease ATP-binding subunit ClpB